MPVLPCHIAYDYLYSSKYSHQTASNLIVYWDMTPCLSIIAQCNDRNSDTAENMGMEIPKNISVLKTYRMEVSVSSERHDLASANIVCWIMQNSLHSMNCLDSSGNLFLCFKIWILCYSYETSKEIILVCIIPREIIEFIVLNMLNVTILKFKKRLINLLHEISIFYNNFSAHSNHLIFTLLKILDQLNYK